MSVTAKAVRFDGSVIRYESQCPLCARNFNIPHSLLEQSGFDCPHCAASLVINNCEVPPRVYTLEEWSETEQS